MRRTSSLATALVALALLAAACARHGARATADPRRIASLSPSTTETLFAIGAGDRVVARSRWCDWPPEAMKLPAVGGLQPDVESLLELRPDLVVGPSGAWSARLAQTLGARGVATWFAPEADTLAAVDASLVALGERVGRGPDARRVVARIDAHEQAIARAVAGEPRPRVLFVVGASPVVVAGAKSFDGDLLAHAGAVDAVSEGPPWPALGFERIAEIDPDVVVYAGSDPGAPRISADAPGWSGLRAVREGHVVALDDPRALRPGPRIDEGLAALARALHPRVAAAVR